MMKEQLDHDDKNLFQSYGKNIAKPVAIQISDEKQFFNPIYEESSNNITPETNEPIRSKVIKKSRERPLAP
jgi:hypothetical protein